MRVKQNLFSREERLSYSFKEAFTDVVIGFLAISEDKVLNL